MAALPVLPISPPDTPLGAFAGPLSLAQVELYLAELDMRIAKLWTEERASPIPSIRRRLETERLDLETLRKDLWYTRLHPEEAVADDLYRDGTPRDDLPDYPDSDEPTVRTQQSFCPACGRDGVVPMGQACGTCRERFPGRVGRGACVGCGAEGEYPACVACEAPF